MNRSDVRKRILISLDESIDAPVYSTISEVNGWIDEGMEILSEETMIRKRRGYLPLKAGVRFYNTEAIDPLCLSPTDFWLQDREIRVEQISMLELSTDGNKWMLTQSDRPHWWFPVDATTFGIHPAPPNSNDALRVDYFAWADTITDDMAELELDDGTVDALIYYGIYRGYLKRWDTQRAVDSFTDFSSVFSDGVYRREIGKLKAGLTQRLTYGTLNNI